MKRFFFIVAAAIWAIFSGTVFAAPVSGVLEVYWELYGCESRDACEVKAVFYPDKHPNNITISPYEFVDINGDPRKPDSKETNEFRKMISETLAKRKKIMVFLVPVKQEELLKLSRSVQGIPESFLRYKERFWQVRAKVDFPKGIEAAGQCADTLGFSASAAIIVETDNKALDNSRPDIDVQYPTCGPIPYEENFTITPAHGKNEIVIWAEPNNKSKVLLRLEKLVPEKGSYGVLKLETIGDGKAWMKIGTGDVVGYIYLPDVVLESVY